MKKQFVSLASFRRANEQIIQDGLVKAAGRIPVRQMPGPTEAQKLLNKGKISPRAVARGNETMVQNALIRKAGRVPLTDKKRD